MVNVVYDKLNETDSLTYIQKSSYGNYFLLIDGSTILYKDIQIEKEGEDGWKRKEVSGLKSVLNVGRY